MPFRTACTGIISICVFFMFVVVYLQLHENRRQKLILQKIMTGTAAADASLAVQSEALLNGPLAGYAQTLQNLLSALYIQDETPVSILKSQLWMGAGTLFLSVLFGILMSPWIGVFFGLAGMVGVVMIYASYTGKLKKKNEEFDRALPDYEINLLLGLEAGATLPVSMEMACKAIDDPLVQIEFRQLLRDIQTNNDHPLTPYRALSKRVPTKDCQRFCNLITAGIQNGTSMSEILNKELEQTTDEQLNAIKEKAQKNTMISTAVSTAFIFIPIMILFMAPLLAQSGI